MNFKPLQVFFSAVLQNTDNFTPRLSSANGETLLMSPERRTSTVPIASINPAALNKGKIFFIMGPQKILSPRDHKHAGHNSSTPCTTLYREHRKSIHRGLCADFSQFNHFVELHDRGRKSGFPCKIFVAFFCLFDYDLQVEVSNKYNFGGYRP